MTTSNVDPDVLARRLERERRARREAEGIAERVTAQLYETVLELEKVNQRLNDTNAALDDTNHSLREFVAVAAHDMRGPLTSILGYSSLLIERAATLKPDQQTDFLRTIRSQGSRMQRLVDDLLTVSRIEAGAMQSFPEDVPLAQAIEECVRQLGDAGTTITVQSIPDVAVLADPDHLNRILANYLNNALKYGAPPVVAEANCVDGHVDVRVRDVGAGVDEAFVPRLFGKFARADDARARAEGTGLGLSIVRGLARANGGDAWYEPNKPKGSCFAVRFRLPAE